MPPNPPRAVLMHPVNSPPPPSIERGDPPRYSSTCPIRGLRRRPARRRQRGRGRGRSRGATRRSQPGSALAVGRGDADRGSLRLRRVRPLSGSVPRPDGLYGRTRLTHRRCRLSSRRRLNQSRRRRPQIQPPSSWPVPPSCLTLRNKTQKKNPPPLLGQASGMRAASPSEPQAYTRCTRGTSINPPPSIAPRPLFQCDPLRRPARRTARRRRGGTNRTGGGWIESSRCDFYCGGHRPRQSRTRRRQPRRTGPCPSRRALPRRESTWRHGPHPRTTSTPPSRSVPRPLPPRRPPPRPSRLSRPSCVASPCHERPPRPRTRGRRRWSTLLLGAGGGRGWSTGTGRHHWYHRRNLFYRSDDEMRMTEASHTTSTPPPMDPPSSPHGVVPSSNTQLQGSTSLPPSGMPLLTRE
mmetsp:Transcript_6889/g.20636  ORF Transcript_6889/g.20636 Transcript_6889/m.20636 type:complete len:409 (+) Transcript_6889:4589-5815(+)